MPNLLSELPIPLSDQLSEMRREQLQRARVYPRLIRNGMLRAATAEQQLAAFDAACDTVQALVDAARTPPK